MFFWTNATGQRLPGLVHPDLVSPPLSILDLLNLSDSEIDWKLVSARAQEAPQELKHRDANRNHTALFLAIQRDAPPFVIQTFLKLYPQAARQVQRLGLSPLHLSVARGTPPEAIQYIVDAWPEAASSRMSDGSVPLHFVRTVETAKILLKAYPEALLCRNNASYLPLHRVATASYASAELVQLLIDAAKSSEIRYYQQIHANTMHGMTPLHVASDMVERDLMQEEQVCPVKWEKLLILARATCDSSRENRSFCLLHVLLESGDIPVSVIQHAIERYPEQRSKLDDRGRSCLCIAASKRETPLQTLTLLLEDPVMDGGLADGSGRLPLHYAAMSGRPFDHGLDLLWKAAPQALTIPDPQTGLYPVLLAATGELNTIFCLLRETPWLIPRTQQQMFRRKWFQRRRNDWVVDERTIETIGSLILPILAASLVRYFVQTLSISTLPIPSESFWKGFDTGMQIQHFG